MEVAGIGMMFKAVRCLKQRESVGKVTDMVWLWSTPTLRGRVVVGREN